MQYLPVTGFWSSYNSVTAVRGSRSCIFLWNEITKSIMHFRQCLELRVLQKPAGKVLATCRKGAADQFFLLTCFSWGPDLFFPSKTISLQGVGLCNNRFTDLGLMYLNPRSQHLANESWGKKVERTLNRLMKSASMCLSPILRKSSFFVLVLTWRLISS